MSGGRYRRRRYTQQETQVANMLVSSGLNTEGNPVTAKAMKEYRKLACIKGATLDASGAGLLMLFATEDGGEHGLSFHGYEYTYIYILYFVSA